MTENLPTLRETDPKALLARYLSDESTKDIAASYGVTRQALGQFLLKTAETEWKEAQVARAIARKEDAEDDLERIRAELRPKNGEEAADVQLSLARMRAAEATLKSAQWDLERVCRRIYGQDAPTTAQAVQINISLRRESATIAPHNEVVELTHTSTSEITP